GDTPTIPTETRNIVDRDSLRRTLVGKRLALVRKIRVITDGSRQGAAARAKFGEPTHRRFTLNFREDGSAIIVCEALYGLTGRAASCPALSKVAGAEGSREIGVWRQEQTTICMKFSRLATGEDLCFTLHREQERLALRPVNSRWACLAGDAVL